MLLPCLQRALRPTLTLSTRLALGKVCVKPPMVRKPLSPALLMQSSDLGTHSTREPMEPLHSPQGAREFIYSLHPTERSCLLKELHRFESIAIVQASKKSRYTRGAPGEQPPEEEPRAGPAADGQSIKQCEQLDMAPPTTAQLRYVLLHNAIPFVGFGFLDNAIMIAAGTQIELSIGVVFGISTMAAAALGNLVSDLAGLGLAGYVEALAYRLGMQIPDLSPKQVDMWQTRVSSHMGKGIGVTIGCLLGMFPLLFIGDDDDDEDKKKEAHPSSN
ncbi:transmembrane protein 65 isoform X1 [Conger conger]|uniref:transmembrane protein 65 isoform X1 n=1 Tax=Conger conger TaxID=82655 RepID=UPI002A5A7FC5|nr:transmembrane protein 65 isoform X1 [Conger conger]